MAGAAGGFSLSAALSYPRWPDSKEMMERVRIFMKFKILDRYEGEAVQLENLKTAASLKYLWLELILNAALVRLLKDTG